MENHIYREICNKKRSDIQRILHKEKGAAHTEWYINKKYKCKKWNINGNFIEKTPGIIKWYDNGIKRKEEWFKNNKNHREKEPAIIEWYETGQISSKEWFKNGEKYRPKNEGPYAIYWNDKKYHKKNKNIEYYGWQLVKKNNIKMLWSS